MNIQPNEEKLISSSIESSTGCVPETNHKVPFCCVIPIPQGFQLVSDCKPKIVYHVGCLNSIIETCRKTVQVEDCGHAEVNLHILKAKGCISFITNIDVEPVCERKACSTDPHTKEIAICCVENICVDHVLKCSVDCLTHVHFDCHNVMVSDLEMHSFCDTSCHFVKIKGNFQFCFA
ncbi:ABC transporter permease [Bacillus cereus]|uniref:ABC transporter permease n=1 Tax=Bacillus cereus TaxID=1396 RepID=UPI001076AEF5|nr:ABC transporter permease [Bacillus cereus]